MVLWGISTVGMGLVNTFEGLVAMRVLLGLFEAGLFPGKWCLEYKYVKSILLITTRLRLSYLYVRKSPIFRYGISFIREGLIHFLPMGP